MTATAATVQPATAVAPVPAAPARADRAAVAAGAGAIVVGAQVLAALAVRHLVRGTPPAAFYELLVGAAAAVAVGWVLLSAGTLQARAAVAWLRWGSLELRAAVLVAALTTCIVVPLGVRPIGSSSLATAVTAVAAAGAQIAGVAGHRRWTRRRRGPLPPPRSPRTLANAAIAAFLATSALTSAVSLPDVYPLSRYPMFSALRTDPHVRVRVRFVGVDADGATTQLRAPASSNLLARMAADDDVQRLEALAADVRRQRGFEQVRVLVEDLQVAPYPATPQVVVVSSAQRVTVDGR